MKNLLKDNYQETGTGYDSFKQAVEEITACTKMIQINTDMLGGKNDGLYLPIKYDANNHILLTENSQRVPINFNHANTVIPDSEMEELMHELIDSSGMILRYNGSNYYFSEKAFFTLKERVGFKSTAIAVKSIERNAFIQKIMEIPDVWNLCVRTDNGEKPFKKVFSVCTHNYGYIPQTMLVEIIDELIKGTPMGTGIVADWSIDQDLTEVIIEFPEVENEITTVYGVPNPFKPCIRLTTSDTGKSMFRVEGIWKCGQSYTVFSEGFVRHSPKVANKKTIMKRIENKIFPDYTCLPERLVELMGIFVTEGKDPEGDKAIVESYLKKINKTIAMKKTISEAFCKKVVSLLLNDFDYTKEITAYDIVLRYLSMSDRLIGIEKTSLKKMESICGKVPYLNIWDNNSSSAVTLEDIFLSA